MPAPSEVSLPGSDLPQMLQMDLDIGDFCSNWAHCDLFSAYLARMVSHNRLDSLLFSNLYSSALNELLETVFRVHGNSGKLECSVRRQGGLDRIELVFPADEDTFAVYREAIDKLSGKDAEKLYLEALFTEDEPDASLGLLELGVDYGARLAIDRAGDGRMCLVAELTLEDENE
ncbi:ubiquinone biosynthesis methyltransferase UbiE [Labrenzia sp. OB1]|uniref:ubiquinone biosynthesis methyltransferase UbiE n=1 Tax=Labrenzia sp. OB1 TaxID=1561204 RepID=UPI0012E777E9|nr:ubiquinone biosynthesis methyltransferase UbiE [Labrenzia sp. OB1]